MRSNCFFYALGEWTACRAKALRWRYSPHWWGHFHVGVIGNDGAFRHYHPIEMHDGHIKAMLFDGHVLDFDTTEPFAKCKNKDCKCHLK